MKFCDNIRYNRITLRSCISCDSITTTNKKENSYEKSDLYNTYICHFYTFYIFRF